MNKIKKFALLIIGVSVAGFASAQTVTTFNYTGSVQTYVVPAGITTLDIDMTAASGGYSFTSGSIQVNHVPGDGGRVETVLTVVPGTTLNIYVGGIGNNADASLPGNGGFNGGATGNATGVSYLGGGGGGASDIRIGGTALTDRVIVAGAGGGSAYNYSSGDNGGNGGDLVGANGQSNSVDSDVSVGIGGSQLVGGAGGQWSGYALASSGALGLGGAGGAGSSGGGGGAGYYGGGGGSWSGGGGGSSYADASITTNTIHTQGFNTGDGQIIITELCFALTSSVSSAMVCEGEMVTLDATSINGGVVTWDNGVIGGTAFQPTIGTTTYTALSTAANDCPFTVDVTVNALPIVIGTVNNGLICFGDSILLIGNGANSYTWDNGAMDNVYFEPLTSGAKVYTVTGTDINNCENTATVNVQVNELVFNAVITNEVNGNDGEIDLTVTGGTNNNNYTWSTGANTEDLNGLSPGNYTVTVNDGICTGNSTFTIVNVLGINDKAKKLLNVYPNPTTGLISIIMTGSFNYTILNILGETVLTGQGNGTTNVSLDFLNRGAYFITVNSDSTKETIKIIKQ